MPIKLITIFLLLTSCIANNNLTKLESKALKQSRMIMKRLEKDEDLQKELGGNKAYVLDEILREKTGCPLSSMKHIDSFNGKIKGEPNPFQFVAFQNQLCSDEVFMIVHQIHHDSIQFETIWHLPRKDYRKQKQQLIQGY